MPLYEYECDACGGRFEVIQKFSETTTECRRCGKGPVRRLMAAPAFQFKGTGWYITDYAQKGKSGADGGAPSKDAAGTKAEAAKSDSAATDSKKSESTPATPATTASKD
jgi:putative FmdB family regulatory protein